jgi:hypothetical protein
MRNLRVCAPSWFNNRCIQTRAVDIEKELGLSFQPYCASWSLNSPRALQPFEA